MDPMTLAAIGIGTTIAGGAVKTAGDLFGGQASGKMYEYQAGLARQRSQVAEQNARYALQTGESEALTLGYRTGQIVGQERAGQGAGNLNVSGGSAAAVRASQTKVGQMSESNIRTTAARRAYGYEVESASDIAQANLDSTASATSRTSSYYDAGASVLGTASSVASKWSQASQAGIPPYASDNAIY